MYTKIKADRIFNGNSFADRGSVLILNDGIIETIVDESEAGDEIQHIEGMIMPGFINAHCHTELSHLHKIIPPDTGLVNFVLQVMKLRFVEPEKEEAIANAIHSMYDSGIVAVADICNTTDSIIYKAKNIYWKNFVEVSGFVDTTAAIRFQDAQRTAGSFLAAGLNATIVPHSPYSVSASLFKLLDKNAEGELISIHNQECDAENELYTLGKGEMITLYKELGIDISSFKPTGKSSLQSWRPYFPTQKIIAVHNTCISEADIDFATNLIYCVCINANLYIENKLPPVALQLSKNADIVLGTDSLASNNELNIWSEIRMLIKHFPEIPLETILSRATINGARALNIHNQYGSFEKGKSPGVVIVNKDESCLFIQPKTS